MENLQALNLKNLDKSNWKTYRFDEIVKNVSERVDPNNTDLEVYVGLDHIDSESIHLKRSGTPDDVDGQKLRFYPGDVIFGRRRAYQRKAAIARTHGFCSAHALVLRANPEVIDSKLFPFFIHSDLFMNCAVDISVGSLSPTINWGTLKHQTFTLPPIEKQDELAELFWAIESVIEQASYVLEQVLILKNTFRQRYFEITNTSNIIEVGDVSKLTAGGTPSTSNSAYWDNGTILWLSSGEVHKKRVFETDNKITEAGLKNSSAKLIPVHSCLIALAGQGKTKGTVAISEVELTTNQSVAAIIPNQDKIEPYYLYHNLDSRYKDFRYVTGDKNSRTGLNLKILKEFKIAYHDKNERIKIASIFNQLDESIQKIELNIATYKVLKKSLINRVF